MLTLINQTPFEAAWHFWADSRGAEMLSVVIKAAFDIPPAGQAVQAAGEQLPILNEDRYMADPGRSSLKYPADLVPQKLATDIGLIGSAHSRDSRPVTHMPVSVQVGDLKKLIVVFGGRKWEKARFGRRFNITAPEPFTRMPLAYERAFGGIDQGRDQDHEQVFDLNPVGTGFIADKTKIRDTRLPNLEDLAQRIKTPLDKPPPAAFGFVAPMWPNRLQYAGTCDDHWRRKRFPLPPEDFDMRFYNAAATGMKAKGFLKGGEPVSLSNVSSTPLLQFNLPRLEINVAVRMDRQTLQQQAAMWTVLFEPDEQRFYMVWGAAFNAGKQPGSIAHIKATMTEYKGGAA